MVACTESTELASTWIPYEEIAKQQPEEDIEALFYDENMMVEKEKTVQ